MPAKTVQVAAGLLEIEATLMICRAQALLGNQPRFVETLLDARAKLNELTSYLLTDDSHPLTELFVATKAESEPRSEGCLTAAEGGR